MNEDEILYEANRRILTDPEFAARVALVREVLNADLIAKTMGRMDASTAILAGRAAAVALVIAALPIERLVSPGEPSRCKFCGHTAADHLAAVCRGCACAFNLPNLKGIK